MARSEGTKFEQAVRNLLENMGTGPWNYNDSNLPGRPDAYNPGLRIAVFCDGCYWHGHGCSGNKRRTARVELNIDRDKAVSSELGAMGIKVIRIWQCEFKRDPSIVITQINDIL